MKKSQQDNAEVATSLATEGFERFEAVRRKIAAAQAEHSAAVNRRADLAAELTKVGNLFDHAADQVRTAKIRGVEPAPEHLRDDQRYGAEYARLSTELTKLDKSIAAQSEALGALQAESMATAFSGGTVEAVLAAQRAIEAATADVEAVRTAIEAQQARLSQIGANVVTVASTGDALSDVLARAALGAASAEDVEAKRAELTQARERAESQAAELDSERAEVNETIVGLRSALADKESKLPVLKDTASIVFAQFVGSEQEGAAQRYLDLANQLTAVLRQMIALDEMGRRCGVPPLLNENWPSCFVLPAVRRELPGAEEARAMYGVMTAGVMIAKPKSLHEARAAERERLRELGVTLI